MYYERLEETDKKLEAIEAWQKKQLIKLYEKSEKKVMKVFKKLGATIPESVKGTNNERR
jgi:hypothetical protein